MNGGGGPCTAAGERAVTVSGEPEIGGYEEERALLKRYLSDEIAPMIFANNAAEILDAPPRLIAVEIQSWIGDQVRGASNMTVADLLAHAATKLHQLGILELVPRDDIARSLTGLRPLLLQLCPAEQRPGFEQMFSHIERSTGIGSSKTEVLHRQVPGGGQAPPGAAAAYPGAGSAAPGLGAAVLGAAAVDPASLRRIDLLLERLQRVVAPGGPAPAGGEAGAVVAHVVEEVATHATSSHELEARLAALQGLGIAGLGAGLFERLSQGLPDWAPPPPESLAGAEPPAVAARAMRKVVRLAKDPAELLARFKELVGVAIEEFNRGALGRSVTMFDLAGRMVEQGDVDSNGAAAQIADSLGALDRGRLEALAEDPDKRLLLHRVMRFFPELRAERLLASLIEEEDRERRLQTLKLLRAHGQEARVEAVHALDESVNGATRRPWHVERNLLYLMRAISPAGDETLDHEIDLLNMTSDLAGPLPVVRESLGALVQLKHPRAFAILAARVSQLEDALTATTSIPLDAKETRLLLSTIIKQLCQCGTNDALEIVIGHGLKGTPQLGDTYARMAQLATQDLSEYPAQLARILDAINIELPRRFLGVSIGAQRKALILDQLVTAVSGTRSPEVLRLLADIVKRFPDQSYATIARDALARSGRPAAESPAVAEDSITLSGDLALFGLPNLLQNLADNRLTGVVTLADGAGRPTGAIELANGQLVTAKAGRLEGDVAVYQLLEQPLAGRFRFLSSEGETPDPVRARSVMSLLMEGMRRYDEFNRARALVADDARFKPSGKKASDVKEDADPKLAKEVWGRAARGMPPAEVEGEIAIDCFRVRRLYEHWVTEGSLVPATGS
jgi:hypothetical protein